MMKKYLILLVLFWPLCALAQQSVNIKSTTELLDVLKIPVTRSAEVKEALGYGQLEMTSLLRNTNMDIAEKEIKLKKFVG